jgi:hypothetical protein
MQTWRHRLGLVLSYDAAVRGWIDGVNLFRSPCYFACKDDLVLHGGTEPIQTGRHSFE